MYNYIPAHPLMSPLAWDESATGRQLFLSFTDIVTYNVDNRILNFLM